MDVDSLFFSGQRCAIIEKNTEQWNQTRQAFGKNNYNAEFSMSSISGPVSAYTRNFTLPEYTLSGKLSVLD